MMLPAGYAFDEVTVLPAPAPTHWYAGSPCTSRHVYQLFAAAAGFSEIWTVYWGIVVVEVDVDVVVLDDVLVDVVVEVEVDVVA